MQCESSCLVDSSSGRPGCTCPEGFHLLPNNRSCVDFATRESDFKASHRERAVVRRQRSEARAYHRSRASSELRQHQQAEENDDRASGTDDEALVADAGARQGRRDLRAARRVSGGAAAGGGGSGEVADDLAEGKADNNVKDAARKRKEHTQERRVRRVQQQQREEKRKKHDVRAETLGVDPTAAGAGDPKESVGLDKASAADDEDRDDMNDDIAADEGDQAEETDDASEAAEQEKRAKRLERRQASCRKLTDESALKSAAAKKEGGGSSVSVGSAGPALGALHRAAEYCDKDVRESARELEVLSAARVRRREARDLRRSHRELTQARREELRRDHQEAKGDLEEGGTDKRSRMRESEAVRMIKEAALRAVKKENKTRVDRWQRAQRGIEAKVAEDRSRDAKVAAAGGGSGAARGVAPSLERGALSAEAVLAVAAGKNAGSAGSAGGAGGAGGASGVGDGGAITVSEQASCPHSDCVVGDYICCKAYRFNEEEEKHIEKEAWKQATLPEPPVLEDDLPLTAPNSTTNGTSNTTATMGESKEASLARGIAAARKLAKKIKREARHERREEKRKEKEDGEDAAEEEEVSKARTMMKELAREKERANFRQLKTGGAGGSVIKQGQPKGEGGGVSSYFALNND